MPRFDGENNGVERSVKNLKNSNFDYLTDFKLPSVGEMNGDGRNAHHRPRGVMNYV
jgi:hypothetical protein